MSIPFNWQGFRIIDGNFNKCFGVAQFLYKGYEISMSEMGKDKGACPTEVTIFDRNNNVVFTGDTAEECINHINQLAKE